MESFWHKIIYQGDGNDISLMDRLQKKRKNGQDAALNRIFLDEILKKTDARERQLIGMRYFKGYDADGDWWQRWEFPRSKCPGWKSGF